jgi:NnrS protein
LTEIYRPFLVAALWCTLTLGATFGAWNLLFIHLSLGEVPPSHQWVHATFQLLGFIQLFVFGIALQIVPRFLGTRLAHPRLARAILFLVLAALLLRTYGALEARVPGALQASAAAAVLELAATLAFARVVGATRRSAPAKPEPFQALLALGVAGWIASALLLCAGAAQGIAEKDVASAAAWNEAFYLCALFGAAFPFVQGVLLRAGPVHLGMAKAPSRAPLGMALLGACGTVLCVAGVAPSGPGHRFLDAGLVCVSAAAVLAAARLRVAEGGPDDETARIVRAALGFAAVFALLACAYAALDWAEGAGPRLLFDASRHAFGLGFLTLMIFGMAGRIVPAFVGKDLRWPRLRRAGTILIACGAGLRIVQALAAITGWQWPLLVSGPSGVVAAAGVALASASILATLRA